MPAIILLAMVAGTAPLAAAPLAFGFLQHGLVGLGMAWPFWVALVGLPGFGYAALAGAPGRQQGAVIRLFAAASASLTLLASVGGVWESRWLVLFLPGSLSGVAASLLLLRAVVPSRCQESRSRAVESGTT